MGTIIIILVVLFDVLILLFAFGAARQNKADEKRIEQIIKNQKDGTIGH